MANTFSQLFVQIVWATAHRQDLIPEKHRDQIEKFICSVSNRLGAKPYAIYCNPDHIHLFVSYQPTLRISDYMRELKKISSKYIKDNRLCPRSFAWQIGYGCFSYAQSQVPAVCEYIKRQPTHHQNRTFEEEYVKFLEHFNIEYDEKYLFDWNDA